MTTSVEDLPYETPPEEDRPEPGPDIIRVLDYGYIRGVLVHDD